MLISTWKWKHFFFFSMLLLEFVSRSFLHFWTEYPINISLKCIYVENENAYHWDFICTFNLTSVRMYHHVNLLPFIFQSFLKLALPSNSFLLAPKVLVEDRWPMMTIHPSNPSNPHLELFIAQKGTKWLQKNKDNHRCSKMN